MIDLGKQLEQAQMMLGVVKTPSQATGIASEISYTVLVNLPGHGVTELTDIRPANDRYPDELKVTAAKAGTPFLCCMFGQKLYCFIEEKPGYGPCSQG